MLEKRELKQCSRCILDTNDDPALVFDDNGVCHHCLNYDEEVKHYLKTGSEGEALITKTIKQLKDYGKNRKYDCLIGLSGGVDSSYVVYLAKQFGLNALCVHFDNGWNTETAVLNIQNMVNKLGFDLYTYVIDWEEFKDLQLAYLKASVIDIEVLTDHATYGTLFKIAKDNDIKYVLGGHNIVTEGVLPYHWTYNKRDYINIRSIHEKHGTIKLATFPFLDRKLKNFIKKSGIEFINYLNWVPFEKDKVKQILKDELGWKDYGGKHFESVWTRFYQSYILPTKFGVDKRKAHLSTLICSGQMPKEKALEEMKQPPCSAELIHEDRLFVLKKLGLTEAEFEAIMKLPVRNHREFDTEGSLFNYYPILKPVRPLWIKFRDIVKFKKQMAATV